MTCPWCGDTGVYTRMLSGYGEPQDYEEVACECPAGRRAARRARLERYQERMEAKRKKDRGLPTFNAIGF